MPLRESGSGTDDAPGEKSKADFSQPTYSPHGCGRRRSEERFLSAQADAFSGSEREEEASARSVRNDGRLFEVTNEEANQVHGGTPGGLDVAGAKRDSSLRRPTRSQEVNAKKRRRPAPFGLTVGCLK